MFSKGWIIYFVLCSVAQSCLTFCDSIHCNPQVSSVHGILQARILEWVTIPFSRGSSGPSDQTLISCIAGGFFTIWATREAHRYSVGSIPLENPGWYEWFIIEGNTQSRLSVYELDDIGVNVRKLPSLFISFFICTMEVVLASTSWFLWGSNKLTHLKFLEQLWAQSKHLNVC